MYVVKEEKSWTVSKIKIELGFNNSIKSLDCYDISPSTLFEKISIATKIPIVYDVLPVHPISLHVYNLAVKDAIELALLKVGLYTTEDKKSYISITKKIPTTEYIEQKSGIAEFIKVNSNPDLYTAHIQQASASLIFERFFSTAQKEFVSFNTKNSSISKFSLENKSFDELLQVICLQLDCFSVEEKGIIYILPGQDTGKEIRNKGRKWFNCTLQYRSVSEVLPLITNRFSSYDTIVADNYNYFICCDDKTYSELIEFQNALDAHKDIQLVRLQFIKGNDLLNNLPPAFKKEDFKTTGDDSQLFFTGSKNAFTSLLEQIVIVDKPAKRIRYDLLIIQFQSSASTTWSPSLQIKPSELGDAFLARADLGSVFDLQFNVLSSFGLTYATKLNMDIKENRAKIFADTSLHGVSGSPITFQNTSTYRYREIILDSVTGKPTNTGVTREIISGLMLDINGWVSGDGTVTTNVSATVSKRGADVSSSIGNPPPTYEKVLTTQVRGRSGEPVVLSGLVQDDSVVVQQRTPFISKIPILGKLFTSESKTDEKTEMVIYLIPI